MGHNRAFAPDFNFTTFLNDHIDYDPCLGIHFVPGELCNYNCCNYNNFEVLRAEWDARPNWRTEASACCISRIYIVSHFDII